LYSTVNGNNIGEVFVMVFQFHEVGDIKESVAFQPYIDER